MNSIPANISDSIIAASHSILEEDADMDQTLRDIFKTPTQEAVRREFRIWTKPYKKGRLMNFSVTETYYNRVVTRFDLEDIDAVRVEQVAEDTFALAVVSGGYTVLFNIIPDEE